MKGSNEERNTYVKKQILETLLTEMETKRLNDIVISSFVDKAGVGRASFYRNYDSLEDILVQESRRLIKQWWEEFVQSPDASKDNVFSSLFDFYRKNNKFYSLVYKAGQSSVILNTILETVNISDDLPNKDAYMKAMYAYGLYGLVIEWIKRKMPESGVELVNMIDEFSSSMKQNG